MPINPLQLNSADGFWTVQELEDCDALRYYAPGGRHGQANAPPAESGDVRAPRTVEEPVGRALYVFWAARDPVTRDDLSIARRAIEKDLRQSGYVIKGLLHFELLFVRGAINRFWVAVTDRYQDEQAVVRSSWRLMTHPLKVAVRRVVDKGTSGGDS